MLDDRLDYREVWTVKEFFNIFTKFEKIFIIAAFIWILTLDVHDMSIITIVNCILLPIILIELAKKYS